MRHYIKSDFKYVYRALLSEGLIPEEMTFKTDKTVISEHGFFSYKIEPNSRFPMLHHVFLNKDKRTFKNFMGLIGDFKTIMSTLGFPVVIVQEPKKKPYMKKLIKFMQGRELYKKDGHTYYLVPIVRRKK